MAMGIEDPDGDEAIAQINITPFVDIALVLLIIFMLTANVFARASIPVALPRAASAGEASGATLNLVLTEAGDLFLDGQAVSWAKLGARIHEAVAVEPRVKAVIAADKAVRFEHLVELIDRLKQGGIEAVALNIERRAAARREDPGPSER
jgi:biopolymer transport protein ExbD